MNLFPYQETGADFLASRHRAGLFDVPGLGKTAQAIAALDRVGAKRIIIVCPAAVREVWAGEFKKFATVKRKVVKANTIDHLGLWLKGKADVLLLSYERARGWDKHLQGDVFDAIVFDEAHYLKSPQAQRTRSMLGTHCRAEGGVARWANHVWFLTGTPLPNSPVDIYPWLRFVGGTTLNLTPFTARYFKARQGAFATQFSVREEMAGELRDAIAAHSIRRSKEEVGLQLPPIWMTTQTVDGDTAEITAILREWPDLEQAILDAIEQGGLSFLDAQHIATLRRLVGEAKAPAFAALLNEELANGLDKVVVMGLHTKALHTLREALEAKGHKVVMVTGATPEAQRMTAVSSFQEDPSVRVFIGNIRAAGTGLTLTAAADLVMFESSWSPADNAQAIMRVHRIGQTRSVKARFISLAGSIDEIVSETVARKTAQIAMVETSETLASQ